ncbi:hypothetical protein ABT270_08755 [Streptomyces sp900105245]|uniref:hypothetical protein n=1 Tax=unclassified Streptomyces TaxID=2593676 RepID=UPI00117CD487|nr:hypothetical protein [Streptomyces sp. CB01883]
MSPRPGSTRTPKCFQSFSIIRPPTGLGGTLVYWCIEHPVRFNATLVLERKTTENWVEIDRSHKGVAPPTDKRGVIEVRTEKRPGLYRAWYAIDVEWLNGDFHEVGPREHKFVVTKWHCT